MFIQQPSIAVSSQTAPYDTFLVRSAARPVEAVATNLAVLAQAGRADSTIGRHLAALGLASALRRSAELFEDHAGEGFL